MSYGTSDTTVISSPNPEARNLNTIDASAAQRDDSSPAPKNRQVYDYRSCCVALVLLCLSGTCFFQRPELRQHPALYTLHKIPKARASPGGPTNMIT